MDKLQRWRWVVFIGLLATGLALSLLSFSWPFWCGSKWCQRSFWEGATLNLGTEFFGAAFLFLLVDIWIERREQRREQREKERTEFLLECPLPLREVTVDLTLDDTVTKENIPDGACMVLVQSRYRAQERFALLAHTDVEYPTNHLALLGRVWSSLSIGGLLHTQEFQAGRTVFGSPTPCFWHSFDVRLRNGTGDAITFSDFLSHEMGVYCTSGLREYVSRVRVTANGFVVFNMPVPTEERYKRRSTLNWPDDAPEKLRQSDWITLTRGQHLIRVSRDTLLREEPTPRE